MPSPVGDPSVTKRASQSPKLKPVGLVPRGRVSQRRILLVLAGAVFLVHASWVGTWLVDDAGISLAYARNLASGHGLRSQPGAPAVEGFSNPLWTLLIAPLTVLPPPVLAPAVKLLSLMLVLACFGLLVESSGNRVADAWAPIWIALSPSFVIWTTSGLENPLFALLGVASILVMEKAVGGVPPPVVSVAAGLVAAGLALTRPDGLAYAALFAGGLARHAWRSADRLPAARAAVLHATAFAAVFGGYLFFRWRYFGDFVPNTYRAKFVSSLVDHDPRRVVDLVGSVAGPLALPLVAALVVAVLFLAFRRGLTPRSWALGSHLAVAAAVYVVLPPDWMGEHRFATLFVVCFWWMLFAVWEDCRTLASETPSARPFGVLSAGALIALAWSAGSTTERSRDFALNPIVPLERIHRFGRAYESLAHSVAEPSLLAPDLGGLLLAADRLRVFDLAGLCDKEIARTLMRDPRGFHDYVFERLRPSFIHAHGAWADWASLHSDPRFERDYVPLHEIWQPAGQPPISGEEHAEPLSGDYVRRSAVPAPGGIAALRAEFRKLRLDEFLP